ncbi:MAG: DNA-formamidopyrimidine glycosylase family protein [Limnochordia bacterium]
MRRGAQGIAELPEIHKLAGQMRDTLRGRTIRSVTLLQEKCANVPPGEFEQRVTGAEITVDNRAFSLVQIPSRWTGG